MGQALLTSQCLRLLKTGDKRYVCHLDYWLGALLGNVMPDMGIGIQARSDNPYFSTLGDYLASLLVSGFLNAGNLRMVTNKQIYNELSNFPVPKVVRDAALVMDFKQVWRRVHSSVLNSDERQIWYLFIHNKLPVQERLFRIGLKNDPYCLFCQTASISDREHVFCQCELTCEAWKWLKLNLAVMAGGRLESDINILSLFIPNNDCQRELIWLLGKYVSYVWNSAHLQGSHVTVEKLFGFLRWKYKEEKSYLEIPKLENLLL